MNKEVYMNNDYVIVNGELYHYGVKGMRWGHRKFQNEDGSLTLKGQKRLADSMDNRANKILKATTRGNTYRVDRLDERGHKDSKQVYEKVLTDEERSRLKAQANKCMEAMDEVNKYPDSLWRDTKSKEYRELSDKAYNYAEKKLKSDYPEYYKQLITEDFEYDKPTERGRKVLREHIESNDDNYWQYFNKHGAQYEKQWKQNHQDNFKKREVAMKKYQQVEKEYNEECIKVTNRILGKYSNSNNSSESRSEGAKYMDHKLYTRAKGERYLERFYEDIKKKKK